jgi:hypothetical protein
MRYPTPKTGVISKKAAGKQPYFFFEIWARRDAQAHLSVPGDPTAA